MDRLSVTKPELGLESKDYAGHSMRRGGATSMAIRGVPVWIIKAIGNWRSDCFMRYIQLGEQYLCTLSTAMRRSEPELRAKELDVARVASSEPQEWDDEV